MTIIRHDYNYTINIFNELNDYKILSPTQAKNIINSITIDELTECWISSLTCINDYPITGHNNYIYKILGNYIWDVEKLKLEYKKDLRISRTCPNRKCINPKHLVLADRLGICEIRDKLGKTAKGASHGRCKNPEAYKKIANISEPREKAIQLNKQGMKIATIAKTLAIPYPTIYSWLR